MSPDGRSNPDGRSKTTRKMSTPGSMPAFFSVLIMKPACGWAKRPQNRFLFPPGSCLKEYLKISIAPLANNP
jgi:hypothetical protein